MELTQNLRTMGKEVKSTLSHAMNLMWQFVKIDGTGRRLSRIEDKLDTILSDLDRIHTRMLIMERQQRGEFIDAAINRLHASAVRLKETADKELQIIKERYGTSCI